MPQTSGSVYESRTSYIVMKTLSHVLVAVALTATVATFAAEDRKAKVLNDRSQVAAAGEWIYNDLPRGFAEARLSGKPLLVVLRCIP